MTQPAMADQAWFHTMALLLPQAPVEALQHRVGRPGRCRYTPRPSSIRLLERHGAVGATLAWSDPTSGCYGEQLWRRCIARRAGQCVVSGTRIAKGDAVYRPRKAVPAPSNSEAMILAAVLEALPVDACE